MERDRVFIIPTYYGFIFGTGVIVCLLAAAIYANNLAYLLCFFLVALFVIGMHQSNSNLKKLKLEKIHLDLSPSNGLGTGLIWLKSDNPEGHIRLRIEGKCDEDKILGDIEYLHPRSLSASRIRIDAKQRGRKTLKRLVVSSRYPFGLFYVWKVFRLERDYFVYPAPQGEQQIPPPENDGSTTIKQARGKGEDFRGHRQYQEGDSQKRIDWKAYARGRPLLVKQFDDGESSKIPIDIPDKHPEFESYLQQASQWVMDCENKKMVYAVRSRNQQMDFGQGPEQQKRALQLLAEVEEKS